MRPPGAGPGLLIDVEILVWRAAWRAPGEAEARARLDRRIAALRAAHGGARALLALSSRPGFRRALWPGYKAGRAPPPPRIVALLAGLAGRPEAVSAPFLEADDVIGILATGGALAGQAIAGAGRAIILSDDKDLRSVPGLHGDGSGGVRAVARADADRAHLLQTLAGDSADGYPGCPGIGPRRAAALLRGLDAAAGWRAAVAAFVRAGRSAAEALVQARLARILRAGDYDVAAGRPRLWRPPAAEGVG